MKNFLIFTILLLSSFSKVFSCGYTPYGEDVRYSLMTPTYFNYKHYTSFEYHANLWGFRYDYDENKIQIIEANIKDWYHYTSKKVKIEDIQDFNYKLTLTDIHEKSDNKFIRYLYENKKLDAIAYLKVAKNCEALTSQFSLDVWEGKSDKIKSKSIDYLNKLIQIIYNEKDIYFKRKYAFLAIRLSHYTGETQTIKNIFETNFKNGNRDYLYYWSSFFYIFTQNNKSMVDIANLMANCPEKVYASYYFFHQGFDLKTALQQAKTKEEIANCYAYASLQKVDKNLTYLKEIYRNNAKSEILGFLLLREINKMEDWVYTPYYTNYNPSIIGYNYDNLESTKTLRNRSEKDRLYAKEVLDFVNSIAEKSVENPVVWEVSKINLKFMVRDYDGCLQSIKSFEKRYKSDKSIAQVEKIKALCITANQENGNAIIKPEIEEIIIKYKTDDRFLFALGRELEFRGNLPDGIALMTLIEEEYEYSSYSDIVKWRGNRIKKSGNLVDFYSYFDYLDFVYDAKSLQIIVDDLGKDKKTNFEKIIYTKLLKDKEYLLDLLGTKYIRENKLETALTTFNLLGEEYWYRNYNPWERGKYDASYSFDKNPFYDIDHTNSFIEHTEKYLVTKLSVVEHLISYQNLANNPSTKDRDYYYFLIANCYHNMSQYGNSWMLRRYNSYSRYGDEPNLYESYIDEEEYRNNLKAIENYKLAFQYAKTEKFKALCMHMMSYADVEHEIYSKKLKTEYPDFYKDLSSCSHLDEYFKARR